MQLRFLGVGVTGIHRGTPGSCAEQVPQLILLRNCGIYTQILFSHWLNAALEVVMEVVHSLTLLTCHLCRQRDSGHQRESLDSGKWKSASGTTLVTYKGTQVGYQQHLLQSTPFPTQTHHASLPISSFHSVIDSSRWWLVTNSIKRGKNSTGAL